MLYELLAEVHQYCKANMKGTVFFTSKMINYQHRSLLLRKFVIHAHFEDEDDAVMFKLAYDIQAI